MIESRDYVLWQSRKQFKSAAQLHPLMPGRFTLKDGAMVSLEW